MKKQTRIIALFLCLCCILMICASCTPISKYEKATYDYLKNKYPNNTFSFVSQSKNIDDTSGRVVAQFKCNEDNVSFDVYIYSSKLITDGYSIEKANSDMNSQIFKYYLNDETIKSKISSITWMRKFKEGNTDGSFVEYDLSNEIHYTDLKSIYDVRFKDDLTLEEQSNAIYDISKSFENSKKTLDNVGFTIVDGKEEYKLNTPTTIVKTLNKEKLFEYIKDAINNSKETNKKQFYWETISNNPIPLNIRPQT